MADDKQYVKLPDGSYGAFPSSMKDAEIVAAIQKNYPQTDPLKTGQGMLEQAQGQAKEEIAKPINQRAEALKTLDNMFMPLGIHDPEMDKARESGSIPRTLHVAAKDIGAVTAPLTMAPAAILAPGPTALGAIGGLIGGTAGNVGGKYIAGKVGLSPDWQDVSGDVGSMAGGTAGGMAGGALGSFMSDPVSFLRGPGKSEPISLNPTTMLTRQLESRVPMNEPPTARNEMYEDIGERLQRRGKEQDELDAAHEQRLSAVEKSRQKELASAERLREQDARAKMARKEETGGFVPLLESEASSLTSGERPSASAIPRIAPSETTATSPVPFRTVTKFEKLSKPLVAEPGSEPPMVKRTYQSIPQQDLKSLVMGGDRGAIAEWRRRGLELPPNVGYMIESGAANKPWRNYSR